MDYQAAILYAEQRMRKLGKMPDEYHYEPIRVSATEEEAKEGYFVIRAFNDLYILVNPQNYYGLFILSDNSAFDSEEPRKSGAPEFTGAINFIRKSINWNLEIYGADGRPVRPIPVEFLRVVIY